MALNINKVLKLTVTLTLKPVTCKYLDITKHYTKKGTNMHVNISCMSSACSYSYSNQVAMNAMELVVILDMCLYADFELLDSSAKF
jgi:hypothetical protein